MSRFSLQDSNFSKTASAARRVSENTSSRTWVYDEKYFPKPNKADGVVLGKF